ncbi:anthranilate phosphoribosyltransferase [Oceanobacillus iheyensis HTE831]|uniref:Anthranilate phosphoribosyltransferase n=1 Tax=Oceanobacillus iheyensis (strain DSM 14371 / CIP 107618 / JCM 11309 / KCTC 3954 / HTE831) TaxID=221109 RepID=TRPD_OCEIH|nr:anthranilate phosphoribosyltransferase [Oceanobacillus iheyensis]Q8ESU1.1 RecName: Full=Anthranilate phosphoribosyltransferase [Oceanobacillus iheyensis HTE831]BAC12481.1 anthranilate phosphoribosyltransferase [Oceanobacillus iheyensis HTE831]
MKHSLHKIIERQDLSTEEIKEVFKHCFSQEVSDSELAAILISLKMKGETAEEVAGLSQVIQEHSPFLLNFHQPVMDNCGTGGDRSNSFNISTCSAFVLAGAGVTVAKHGNRSVSSQTGSADVLEKLGVSLAFTKEQVNEMLDKNQIAFLFAQHVHPTLKQVGKVRKDLRIPTIFNFIGPLTNPVHLDSQYIGVYDPEALQMVAKAAQLLGRERAIVIHGAGGLDEASLQGENKYILVENDRLEEKTIHPEEVGLSVYPNDEIQGGNATENANILLSVLKGEDSAYLDTVLFNAGIALFASKKADSIYDGVELARESITSGSALSKLNNLITFSKKVSEVV